MGSSPCAGAIPKLFFSSFGSSKFANYCRNVQRCDQIQPLRVRVRKKLQILNAELGIWDHCRQEGEDCTWICALFPAVMLDMVQHASFLMDSLGLLNKCRRQGRAEQFRITFGRKEGVRFTRSRHSHCIPCRKFLPSHLGLDVVPRHDVADCSQSWRGHFVIVVPAGKSCKDKPKSIISLGYSQYSLPCYPICIISLGFHPLPYRTRGELSRLPLKTKLQHSLIPCIPTPSPFPHRFWRNKAKLTLPRHYSLICLITRLPFEV